MGPSDPARSVPPMKTTLSLRPRDAAHTGRSARIAGAIRHESVAGGAHRLLDRDEREWIAVTTAGAIPYSL